MLATGLFVSTGPVKVRPSEIKVLPIGLLPKVLYMAIIPFLTCPAFTVSAAVSLKCEERGANFLLFCAPQILISRSRASG
jgi:hypothetical protein